MQSNNYAYVNGEYVPQAQASISVFDRGFLFGDGAFETMPIYGKKIFRFHQHAQRLFDGLKALHITAPVTTWQLADIFRKLCEGVNSGVARVYVTRGSAVATPNAPSAEQPSIIAMAWSPSGDVSPQNLRAMISSVRVNSQSILTRIKSANRLPYVLAYEEARQAGMDEAVMLNERGYVAEFSAYNLFAMIDGRLFSPPLSDGALPGITRKAVFELAEALEIPAQEMELKPNTLADAQEIFATNSVREIVPVTGLNNHPDETWKITRRLQSAYRELVARELSTPGP